MADEPAGRAAAPDSTLAVATALKALAETLSTQTKRQADVVESFAAAIRELARDLHRAQAHIGQLEARLAASELRAQRVDGIVGALARQGWLQ